MSDEPQARKRSLFIALQVAAAKGVGLKLTHDEVVMLSLVTPIEETAYWEMQDRGLDITEMSFDEIAKVKP